MRIGVPKEIKDHEYRVAITPAGVYEAVRHGHQVLVETGAGVGSSLTDDDYRAVGATIVDQADDVWAQADLLLKVKEPIAAEYHRLRRDQVLFTYLTWRRTQRAPGRYSTPALQRSPTRPFNSVTAPCPSWRRCPRSPGGSLPRSEPPP